MLMNAGIDVVRHWLKEISRKLILLLAFPIQGLATPWDIATKNESRLNDHIQNTHLPSQEVLCRRARK
jgi:hypothetical protein